MTVRKSVIKARELNDRINELKTQKVLLNNNRDELNKLQMKLRNGDRSVMSRVNELFDLIDEKRKWISDNTKLIKEQLAS